MMVSKQFSDLQDKNTPVNSLYIKLLNSSLIDFFLDKTTSYTLVQHKDSVSNHRGEPISLDNTMEIKQTAAGCMLLK